MINFKEFLKEGGLWANIHAKRERIKRGSGERMRKPGEKGAPTAADFKAAQNEEVVAEGNYDIRKDATYKKYNPETHTMMYKDGKHKAVKHAEVSKARTLGWKARSSVKAFVKAQSMKEELSLDEQFDIIEEVVTEIAEQNNVDPEAIWETLESIDDIELLEYAIDKKGYKSSTGGLTQKGVDAYNRETGGNLKTAVTTPPSKLKPGSKAANRRKSFCARMSGVKGPMKDENGKPTRKALALRKWNC